jgi:dolichol-phosphate mannosyltransferase
VTDTHPIQANTLSVAVPARDEEANLEEAVAVMIPVIERHFSDYEIFIYDDGSSDRTGEIAEQLAAQYEHVSAFHNRPSIGLGGVVREGLKRAGMEYFMYIDGKAATTAAALDLIFAARTEADLVVPYMANRGERSLGRRVVSRLFVAILNTTFRLDLQYYNHLLLCRTEVARRANVRTASYAFQAERTIKLIKSGCSYVQVGVEDRYDLPGRRTKAFHLRNVLGVAAFYIHVLRDVRAMRGRQ